VDGYSQESSTITLPGRQNCNWFLSEILFTDHSNRRRPYPLQLAALTKGGLGKEFLKAFAISGARSLAILDRDLPIAKEACDEIRNSVRQELGVHDDEVAEVNAWGCDVTKEDEVRRIMDEIGSKFGGNIDIFVGAAGITPDDRINDRDL
jgi:NADP-dependent 3-hydroxy acid dehydrogenase YdfG